MEEVRRIRKERGLSQERLADLANIDRANLSLIETGRRSPSIEVLQKLADGLGVEVADFFPRRKIELAVMWGTAPERRRRLLRDATDEEVEEYVRDIDRALGRAAEWGKDEQDQTAVAAYRAFLGGLRAEAAPFVVVTPTPDRRAVVAHGASVASSTAG